MTSKTHHVTTGHRHPSTHVTGIRGGSCLCERLAGIGSSSSAKPELSRSAAAPSSSVPEPRRRPCVVRPPRRPDDDEKKQKKSEQRRQPFNCDHGETKKSAQPQPSKFFCGICFDHKPVSDRFKKAKCNHPFCTHCISKHVATQISQNILKVICPTPNCSVELKPESLRTVLPREVIVRWECARRESLLVRSEKTYCPFKDCSVLLVNGGRKFVTCPSCHRLLCAQCKVPWHGRMTCKEFQRSKRNKVEKELDNKFFNLAKEENWQKCPQCAMFVQSSGGCEHISCRCGCNFCYICGEIWKFGHLCKKRPST